MFKGNTKNGKGKDTFSPTSYYEGDFKGGVKHGEGIHMLSDNHFISGRFKNGLAHGKGNKIESLIFLGRERRKFTEEELKKPENKGAVDYEYDGEFFEGLWSGDGVLVEGGDKYVGEFVRG